MARLPALPIDANKCPTPDPLGQFAISDMDEGTTSYYGYLNIHGGWVIQKVTSTAVRYCTGLKDYSTAWTGRAGLTYGTFSEVF